MAKDNYIVGHLYVPIVLAILLMVMIYFHRYHALKYLYLINLFCFILAVVGYLVLIRHPVGYDDPRLWIQAMPFVFLIGISAGYFLSIISVTAFVIEQAQRHIWAKVVMGVAGVTLIVLCIIGVFLLIQGILSLKSG